MGVDISVGSSEDRISEKLGSYTSILAWKRKIADKEGVSCSNGYSGKFKLVMIHSGGKYKVDELPKLLEELNEIKKLNIEEYDTAICFNTEETIDLDKMKISKGLKYKETQIITSEVTIVDKFIRICKIAIERQLPINIG